MARSTRMQRIKRALSVMLRAIGAVFYPPNLRSALRSVTSNPKEYACFYLAALVVTTGFWTVSLTTQANLHEADTQVRDNYDYHFEIANLDNEQKANLDYWLDYALVRADRYIENYRIIQKTDGTYSAYITLNEKQDLNTGYTHIRNEYMSQVSVGARVVRFSPLFTFEQDYGTPYRAQLFGVSFGWLCLSVLIFVVLYLVRLEHFKFMYGIYMTCGADFAKLFGAAGGELLAVTALTYLPALLIGVGITAALYVPHGIAVSFSLLSVSTAVLGGLLAILLAVWFPMRRLSQCPPIRLLSVVDHGHLVSSPRRSFFLFGQAFPGRYELYSLWRMRKYYARLILSAVIFAAFFVSGLYIADMEQMHNDLDPCEYIVLYQSKTANRPSSEDAPDGQEESEQEIVYSPSPEEAEMIRTDADYFLDEISAVPGVSHVLWTVSTTGGQELDHLILKPGQLYNAGSYTVPSEERRSEGYTAAMNHYAYTAVDKRWIDTMIENDLCTFEGDPYAVLTGERQVIISEDVYNQKTYDFKPGDTVLVAVAIKIVPMNIVTDPQELLRQQIKLYDFCYEPYTVCAVMRGRESDYHITLGVSCADYTELTGQEAVRDELRVYMKSGTAVSEVRAAEEGIRDAISPFSGWRVTSTGNYFEAQVKGLKNDRAVIYTLAVCLLLISPLVWYFSQVMFYRKRRQEFAVLYALGAPRSSYVKLHRVAGGVITALAFAVTVPLAYFFNWVVYFTVGTLLPKLHIIDSVYYRFTISAPALAACLLISVICGYLSAELPYWLFTRKSFVQQGTNVKEKSHES